MLDQMVRAGWDRLMKPVGRSMARMGVSANALTVVGFLIQIVAALLVLRGRLLAAGLVVIAGALFDVFDGAVAKATGPTKFGALLDSTLDRLSDAVLFGSIVWLYGVDPDVDERRSLLIAGLALGNLLVAFLVSYVKARAEGLGYEANIGIAERAERVIVMVVGLLFDILLIALAVLVAASAITFLQRLLHIRAQAAGDR